MTERFEIFPQNVAKDGTLIIIQKGLKLYNISDVVDLLNELNEENQQLKRDIGIKKRCCANSHNAHQFLKCYEKAIEDLENEYEGNNVAKEVLGKLDKYYDKYERMVELE